MAHQKQYRAFSYLRLSREDGDKSESDSILNQRKLINAYLLKHNDIILIDEFVDDGWSGTNFQRPSMVEMLQRLEDGEADCVVVKDMSRFGRDFIQVGRYVQQIFPQKGIRFIAINDGFDSSRKNQIDEILIPIKNLMNDSYCSELSRKLRNQFQVQWRNGEFLGAFASYGYQKSPYDKHKLIIDEIAAEVVKGIFYAKLKGYSMLSIADQLNRKEILPPSAYKQSKGLNYHAPTATQDSGWTVNTIRRILQNRIYVGDLEQGKHYKEYYKSNRILKRPRSEWVVIQNNHEPVIDLLTFEAVQRDLATDTRQMDSTGMVAPLSGLTFCADCGRPMIQKCCDRGRKRFTYYICSGHKKKLCPASHSISRPLLEQKVRNAINAFVCSVLDIQTFLERADDEQFMKLQLGRIDSLVIQLEAEIAVTKAKQASSYQSKLDGTLTKQEFIQISEKYSQRISQQEQEMSELKRQHQELLLQRERRKTWLTSFRRRLCFDELSRETVLMLVQQVTVSIDKEITIQFTCQDEYRYWLTLINKLEGEVV